MTLMINLVFPREYFIYDVELKVAREGQSGSRIKKKQQPYFTRVTGLTT